MKHFVYLIICFYNKRLISYVGYTNDIKKRLKLHNSSKGAKFTRGRKWKIIYKKSYNSKSEAMKNEYLLKKNKKKRFEIKKRIFSFYNQEIKEASNDYKIIDNYILLASICVLEYKKTKNLKYINVLLKLNDTICSQINIISENNTSFLCFFALKSELDYILDLIKKNGIN